MRCFHFEKPTVQRHAIHCLSFTVNSVPPQVEPHMHGMSFAYTTQGRHWEEGYR